MAAYVSALGRESFLYGTSVSEEIPMSAREIPASSGEASSAPAAPEDAPTQLFNGIVCLLVLC